jgi:hypothetical protein
MAMGIPVVATPQAAKGVQAVPGQHLLVGDGPEAFAKHVIDVLQNGTVRNNLLEAARQQVENVHAWPLAMDCLERILSSAPTAINGLIRSQANEIEGQVDCSLSTRSE